MVIRVVLPALALAVSIASAARADESPGIQSARRHFLESNFNVLTFHSVEELFTTRRIAKPDSVWAIPQASAKLDFTYDYAGTNHPAEDVLERTYTNALVIIKHGKIVAETYRNLTSESTHFISFSMAKSVTSMLIGIALADGSIHSVDDLITAYVPELKNTAYDGVTIRQALQMRSGANYAEVYVTDKPDLLQTAFELSYVEHRARFVDFTRTMTRAYPPGEHFNYSTFETCVLGWVLERATKQSVTRFSTERLWKPAGMESYGLWMIDGSEDIGREFVGGGLSAVARDYARLGLMMLRNGKAGDRQVVPAAWVKESTMPNVRQAADPAEPSFGYNYQWWPLVDSQAFMARGLQGQTIFVDPGTETVIVKLGYVPPGNREASAESIEFFKAVSRWDPSHP